MAFPGGNRPARFSHCSYPVYTGTRTLLLKFNRLKRDGIVFGVSVFGQDITERIRSEEALKESEAKYRSLYESMMDGYVLVDMDGRILKFNEAYRDMTGYTHDELLRTTYRDITPEKWHAAGERSSSSRCLSAAIPMSTKRNTGQKTGPTSRSSFEPFFSRMKGEAT